MAQAQDQFSHPTQGIPVVKLLFYRAVLQRGHSEFSNVSFLLVTIHPQHLRAKTHTSAVQQ